MITLSNVITVGRSTRVRADLNGDNRATAIIAPRDSRQEYVLLVLGVVPRGAVVTPQEVVEAVKHYAGFVE